MTKNVNVVDDLGNRYVPTYAKRAKGLVKNGRARWVDENTICLACPPDELNLEDTEMENKINPIENIVAESAPLVEKKTNPIDGMVVESQTSELKIVNNGVTLMDILERMDRIIAQGDALRDVVQEIRLIPVNESPEGGRDGQARAEAIESIVCNREANNKRMLEMLNRMYDDMMGRTMHVQGMPSQSVRAVELELVKELNFAGMMPETAKIVLDALMGKTDT